MAKLARIQALDRDYNAGKIPQNEYAQRRSEMVADYNYHQAAVAATIAQASGPAPWDSHGSAGYGYGGDPYGMSPELAALYHAPGRYDYLYNTSGYGGTVAPGKPPSYDRGVSPQVAAQYRASGRYDHLYNTKGYGGTVAAGKPASYNTKGYGGTVAAGKPASYNTKGYGNVIKPGQPATYNVATYNPNVHGGTIQPGSKGSYNKPTYKTDSNGTAYLAGDRSLSGYQTGTYDPNTGQVAGGTKVASPWLLKGKPEIDKHEATKKSMGKVGSAWTWLEEKAVSSEMGGVKGVNNAKTILVK